MRAALGQLRTSGFTSAGIHIAVVVVAQFGLPFLFSAPPVTATVIPVDVVRLDDITRPPPAATPEPEPETTRAATPQAPPRPPQPVPEPPSPPEVTQQAKAEPAPPPPPVTLPAPKPEPPVAQPEPEPAPEPEPQVAKATPKAKPKPPAPQRDFASVLKDLAAQDRPTKAPERARKPETVQNKGDEAPQQSQVSERASIRELDRLGNMIRDQISPCWSPPPGARDADTLLVSLEISVDPQGNVSRVTVVDSTRMVVDRFFRSAAEAAQRAVLKCAPLDLPVEQYDIWKQIKFNFDPSKMLS